MRRSVRALTFAVPLGLLAFVLGSGCFAPPALLPAVAVDVELARRLLPAGSEAVELVLSDGAVLRGDFVPSDAGAPVVLHLHESSGSSASLQFHHAVTTQQLAELGFASLLLDYEGVGASPGEASVEHLARDAHAMYAEALRRAGGDEARVVLRGTSLGTLAAAILLRDGARPAAVFLHAPVMADSAVAHMAERLHGSVVGWIADAVFDDIADVDLAAELARVEAPLLVICGRRDLFLDDEERAAIEQAVRTAGGTFVLTDDGHAILTVAAHALHPDELAALRVLLPGVPDGDARLTRLVARLPGDVAARFEGATGRARLSAVARTVLRGDPVLAAAFALADDGASTAALRHRLLLDERGYVTPLGFDALCEAVRLDTGWGRLPIDVLERLSFPSDVLDRFGIGSAVADAADALAGRIARTLSSGDIANSVRFTIGWDRSEILLTLDDDLAALRDHGFSDEQLPLALAKLALEARRIPSRVRRDAHGVARLEADDGEGWRVLDLETIPEDFSGSFTVGGGRDQPLGRRAAELVDGRRASSATSADG